MLLSLIYHLWKCLPTCPSLGYAFHNNFWRGWTPCDCSSVIGARAIQWKIGLPGLAYNIKHDPRSLSVKWLVYSDQRERVPVQYVYKIVRFCNQTDGIRQTIALPNKKGRQEVFKCWAPTPTNVPTADSNKLFQIRVVDKQYIIIKQL